MNKKPKTKRIIGVGIFIGIILLMFIGTICYLIVEDLKQEDILKQEIVNITNKDLLTDNFTIEVKTKGDYAYIEEAIKTYYKELSDNIKLMNSHINNEELIFILSADNLANDGPNFEKSYKTLTDVKNNTNTAFQQIIDLCNEETIKNLINKEKIDDYYYNLYLELMYTEDDLKELAETKEEMQNISNDLNLFLEKIEEMLKMLEKNSNSWVIEEGQLYFDNNELVNEYNRLYQELNDIVEEKFSKYETSETNNNESTI